MDPGEREYVHCRGAGVTHYPRQRFTADWFTKYAPAWISRMGYLRDQSIAMLEIGSYEGRSTCWFLDNLLRNPRSSITCIDTWDGADATLGALTQRAYILFQSNTIRHRKRMTILRQRSVQALSFLITERKHYRIIFVDGDHEGFSALSDVVMAWELLEVGGHLVFDDYQWESDKLRKQPHHAWDAFVSTSPPGLKWELDGRQVFATKEST